MAELPVFAAGSGRVGLRYIGRINTIFSRFFDSFPLVIIM